MRSRVLWIVLPLLLAIAGIEVGLLTLPRSNAPILLIAEIACGVVIVIVLVRATYMSDGTDKPNRKRVKKVAAIVAAVFAAYMCAYESTENGAGLFIGNTPHRHFMKWSIPRAADPLFAPGDWIDEKAREVWHVISG
jgi:hypothetical protein